MTFCKTVLSLVVLLLASALSAFAQGTYTQIDYPGGTNTNVLGVDSAGDVSGYYQDASTNYHGFLLSSGIYTTIDYPGAAQTQLFGMNDVGQVVGVAGLDAFGFVYDVHTQEFTQLACRCGTGTIPLAINDAGAIAGSVIHQGIQQGFELIGTTYNKIVPHGAKGDYLLGITSSGDVIGYAAYYFSFSGGKYQRLAPPPGLAKPSLWSINPAGTALVGYYSPTGTSDAGFIYQNGTVQTLQFPGATDTYAFGMSSTGEVVGQFFGTGGDGRHGFNWTPPAAARGRNRKTARKS